MEVMAWFATADWGQFTTVRQELLLRFMEMVQAAGAEFAFPMRDGTSLAPTRTRGPARTGPSNWWS